MSTGQFHKLLSPLSLGSGLTLKNRMIKAPQSSWFFEDDGSAGDRVIDFYEAIAAGGVGLVIVSAITWRSDHPAGAYGALHDDRFLPGMKRLVERCHAHGCPVFCQLHHSGASAMTGHGGGLPIGLLKARAVLVFNTSNTPEARELEAFGDPLQRLWRDCICDFCGVTTFDRVMFRVVADSTPADRRTWLEQARTMTRESFPSEWNSAARSD